MDTVYWEGRNLRNTHLFSPAATTKRLTGQYCQHPVGSKAYHDFWVEEKRRCIEGYTSGDVRITGYNYFFLNYHQLDVVVNPKDKASAKIKTFPRFWKAHFNFFNVVEYCEQNGKHLVLLKPRGTGLSEVASAMAARDFTFSQRTVDGIKHNKVFFFASEEPFLNKDGVLNPKCWDNLNFLYSETQLAFRHLRQEKDQDLHKKASVKKKDGTIVQTGGEIIGRVVDNVDKVRGARGYKLFFEEAGAFKNLEKAVRIATPLVEQGGVVTGTMIIWGTSNEGVAIEGLKTIFLNPDSYNVLKFKNVWGNELDTPLLMDLRPEEYMAGEGEDGVGWFIPRHHCMDKFMDADGNPQLQEAYEYIIKERKKKEGTKDFVLEIADNPIFPDEALRKVTGSPFNTTKIAKQLSDLNNKHIKPDLERGELHWKYAKGTKNIIGVEWIKTDKGPIEILEHPKKSETGESYINLYVAGIDSIDKGISDSVVGMGGSKFCIMVKKRTLGTGGNFYVCKYKERPLDVREAYENALKILMYYDCNVNLEDTKINIIAYFREHKQYNRLIKRPRIARPDKMSFKVTNLVGTPASDKVIQHQVSLIKDYVEDFYQDILFVDVLEELRDYDPTNKTAFDIIAAMGMCELYDEELSTIAPRKQETVDEWTDIGWYVNAQGHRVYGAIPKNKHIKNDWYKHIKDE